MSAEKMSPAAVFAALSLLFGSLIILVTPPLRGPDETAHFLRAYGVGQGDIIPSLRTPKVERAFALRRAFTRVLTF